MKLRVAMAQEHMEGTSVQTRDEPTSVDAGSSEFFTATEASSSNLTAISSSVSACQDRACPSSETFYLCIQGTKEHNGECSADVPMTTEEQAAEANSESAERVTGFSVGPTEDQVAKIMLQIAVGMSKLHKDNITHRDLKASNVLINNHRQHGGRYKPKR